VPAARADHQHGGIGADGVMLAAVGIGEVERAEPAVAQVDLALDQLVPDGRGRVLEIGHEDFRARIERVDDHLGIGRAGDLDPAILKVGRDRRDGPVRFADVAGFLREVGKLARVEMLLPLDPRRQQLAAAVVEPMVKLGDEGQRLAGQHLVCTGQVRPRDDRHRPVEDRAHPRASCVIT
jgi:hypothetical protein